MPELPEVETARQLIADQALRRRIVAVDDADTFVCRPHSPGELRDALTGRSLTAACRRGKTMWCETSGTGRSAVPGPDLGIHLGMGGRIVVTSAGHATEGGGPARRDAQPRKPEWNRFTLQFADGGTLVLFDKRRLGRIRLQIFGFLGCAVGLAIASFSIGAPGNMQLVYIFTGVMLFNFMTNLGPNAQTYLLAGEVFPTEVRGMGAGFAAMVAKVGAVGTTFGFPLLLASIGTTALLWALVVCSVLGAVVTWIYRIETTGVNLDQIGR